MLKSKICLCSYLSVTLNIIAFCLYFSFMFSGLHYKMERLYADLFENSLTIFWLMSFIFGMFASIYSAKEPEKKVNNIVKIFTGIAVFVLLMTFLMPILGALKYQNL